VLYGCSQAYTFLFRLWSRLRWIFYSVADADICDDFAGCWSSVKPHFDSFLFMAAVNSEFIFVLNFSRQRIMRSDWSIFTVVTYGDDSMASIVLCTSTRAADAFTKRIYVFILQVGEACLKNSIRPKILLCAYTKSRSYYILHYRPNGK
jgi:hypothetical protein